MSREAAPNLLKWFGLAAFLLVGGAVALLAGLRVAGYGKLYYSPSDSMAPTIMLGDRFIASQLGPGALQRGDLIMFRAPAGGEYMKRIAALPGDRIAMRGGLVILNGRPIPQRLVGTDVVAPNIYGSRARRLAEQFPGEEVPHQIYDSGPSAGDDVDEQLVTPGHVFVLGDNRDHSADSRYPLAEQGVEQLPIDAIYGHLLFFVWCPNRSCAGESIH